MKEITRRSFLKNSALAATTVSVLPGMAAKARAQTSANSRVIGANDDIRVAVVGFNSRGGDHIKEISELKGVRIVALCDVDSAVLERGVKLMEGKGQPVTGYGDIRKLLENKDIDAITVATPNHWHALAAIWAIQAGKDVYLEKPVCHEVWEGRQIVKAARKYERIVQTGTQSRSGPGLIEAIQWLHDGNLGKIKVARGLCYKRRASIGKTTGPQPVPATVDYDLWCGPAPKDPLRRAKLHYDWHWVWPTGNGDLGNQGIHEMDVARWALGENELSPRIISVGGRLGYEDDATTPNTLVVCHEYKNAPLIFEVRGLPENSDSKKMDNYDGASIGIVIDCEHGRLVIPTYTDARAYDTDGKQIKRFQGNASHFANFFGAMRSRKVADLHADIEQGFLSSALCHTANISYRLGEHMQPEKLREAISSDHELSESVGRMMEHLGANGVDLAKTPATLGALLTMDPTTERFIGNDKANDLLTRDFRKPFVVPTEV